MAKKFYIGISDKARNCKKAYIGISDKARKIKKMYIGIGGKAKLLFELITYKSFTANIFPSFSRKSIDIDSDTLTDDYGTWSIQGSGNFYSDGQHNITHAFDSSSGSYWDAVGGTGTKHMYIKMPSGVSINPKEFLIDCEISNSSRGGDMEIYGITEGGKTVTLCTATPTTSSKLFTLTCNTSEYFTRLGVKCFNKTGNTSTWTFSCYYFHCTAGTMKIQ